MAEPEDDTPGPADEPAPASTADDAALAPTELASTEAAPTEAVPTEAVPTEAVPTEAAPLSTSAPTRPVAAPKGASTGRSPAPALAEFFTMRRALATEAKLGETVRTKLARSLALGTQKAEAAETLWQNGHSAEGLRLGIESLDATLAALPIYAAAIGLGAAGEPKDVRAAALRDRGLTSKEIASVESAYAAAHAATLPESERDVAPTHTPLWRDVAAAQHRVARAMRDTGRTRRELRMTSFARIANTALIALLAIGGFVLATRTPEGVFVESSGVWADAEAFSGEKAIDGRDDTWWLAPDGVEATLDVTISPPRRVPRIRLLNGTNPPHHDRGTRDYRVELFVDGRVARTIEGTLEHQTAGAPEHVEHEVGLDGVERIRFTARTHYAIGAGLSELQFE